MLIGSSCSVRKIATPQVYRGQFMTTKIFFRNKQVEERFLFIDIL